MRPRGLSESVPKGPRQKGPFCRIGDKEPGALKVLRGGIKPHQGLFKSAINGPLETAKKDSFESDKGALLRSLETAKKGSIESSSNRQ